MASQQQSWPYYQFPVRLVPIEAPFGLPLMRIKNDDQGFVYYEQDHVDNLNDQYDQYDHAQSESSAFADAKENPKQIIFKNSTHQGMMQALKEQVKTMKELNQNNSEFQSMPRTSISKESDKFRDGPNSNKSELDFRQQQDSDKSDFVFPKSEQYQAESDGSKIQNSSQSETQRNTNYNQSLKLHPPGSFHLESDKPMYPPGQFIVPNSTKQKARFYNKSLKKWQKRIAPSGENSGNTVTTLTSDMSDHSPQQQLRVPKFTANCSIIPKSFQETSKRRKFLQTSRSSTVSPETVLFQEAHQNLHSPASSLRSVNSPTPTLDQFAFNNSQEFDNSLQELKLVGVDSDSSSGSDTMSVSSVVQAVSESESGSLSSYDSSEYDFGFVQQRIRQQTKIPKQLNLIKANTISKSQSKKAESDVDVACNIINSKTQVATQTVASSDVTFYAAKLQDSEKQEVSASTMPTMGQEDSDSISSIDSADPEDKQCLYACDKILAYYDKLKQLRVDPAKIGHQDQSDQHCQQDIPRVISLAQSLPGPVTRVPKLPLKYLCGYTIADFLEKFHIKNKTTSDSDSKMVLQSDCINPTSSEPEKDQKQSVCDPMAKSKRQTKSPILQATEKRKYNVKNASLPKKQPDFNVITQKPKVVTFQDTAIVVTDAISCDNGNNESDKKTDSGQYKPTNVSTEDYSVTVSNTPTTFTDGHNVNDFSRYWVPGSYLSSVDPALPIQFGELDCDTVITGHVSDHDHSSCLDLIDSESDSSKAIDKLNEKLLSKQACPGSGSRERFLSSLSTTSSSCASDNDSSTVDCMIELLHELYISNQRGNLCKDEGY